MRENKENSGFGFDGVYDRMISEEDLKEEEHPAYFNQDNQQVNMSMVRSESCMRHSRLLALSLALLAAVLLLVDIGLGVHYSTLKDGHITFDHITYINDELIKLQDTYKIAVKSTREANKQLANEIKNQQLTKWELEHQTKRGEDYDEEIKKIQTEVEALRHELTMIADGCRRCLPGWILMNSVCYHFALSGITIFKPWQEAREFCQIYGGDLAVIDSKEEQLSLVNHLSNSLSPSMSVAEKGFWIGLRDLHEEGNWKWLDGRTLVEGYWHDGEPNDINDEDCAALYPRPNPFKTWNDVGCIYTLRWICEMAPKS
ncbi:hypothetical protein LDENG_00043210 [Lucifuga dentata]|nr:hypothetical protein LDENG_00043210 [Lucifuga dentata]